MQILVISTVNLRNDVVLGVKSIFSDNNRNEERSLPAILYLTQQFNITL